MDNSSRLQFLFDKYLQRDCSAQETDELFFLLQRADAEASLTPQMQLLWEEIKNDRIHYKVDWEKMYSSVVNSGRETDVIISRATTGKRRPSYAIFAALILLLIALPAYWLFYRTNAKKEQSVTTVSQNNNDVHDAHPERQTIHLPDGSTVILNAGSKLNYPSAFGTKHRDVYLTGEGFFDIKHISSKPFYVHVGKIAIKVLGTAFNIKAYNLEDNVEVTVTRGKVQVIKENKIVGTLTASQQISVNNQKDEIITKTVDTIPVIAWKPAEIFYNDITMAEAVGKLEQRFNIKVEFSNAAIKSCRVTATFSEDDLPDEIMTVICAVSNATFKTEDDKFIIDGKGCN